MLKQYTSSILILLPYLFLFSGVSLFANDDKRMVLLSVIALGAIAFIHRARFVKDNLGNFLFVATLIFAVYVVIHNQYRDGSSSLMRAYFAPLLLLLFYPIQILTKKVWVGLCLLCSVLVFANSAYFTFYLGLERNAGLMNVIPYATFCSGIAILSFHHVLQNIKSKTGIITLVSFLLSCAAVMLTLSRGVWLALLAALVIMLCFHARNLKHLSRYFAIFIISSAALLFIFKDQVEVRVDQTLTEVQRIQSGDMASSIGLRFQIWQAAYYISQDHFWLGVGNEILPEIERLNQEDKVSRDIINFHVYHFHNQFIDALVRFGFIGLLLFLPIYLIPIYIALKSNHTCRVAILGLSTLYIIASLTDVPFYHSQTVLLYIMLMIPLCGFAQTQKNDKTEKT